MEPTVALALAAAKVPTYIGVCCREWVLATFQSGRCGLCNQTPTYLRADDARRPCT